MRQGMSLSRRLPILLTLQLKEILNGPAVPCSKINRQYKGGEEEKNKHQSNPKSSVMYFVQLYQSMKCKWSRGSGKTKVKTFLKMVIYHIESGDSTSCLSHGLSSPLCQHYKIFLFYVLIFFKVLLAPYFHLYFLNNACSLYKWRIN